MDEKNSLYKDINYSNKLNTIQKSLGISKYIKNMSSMQSSIYNLAIADSGLKYVSNIQKSLGISKYIKDMSSIQSSIYNLALADSSLKYVSNIQKSLGISKYIKDMSSAQSSIYNLVLADSGLKCISSIQKSLGINKTIKNVSKLQNFLEKQKIVREKYLNELKNENITINNDGSICVDSGIITKQEIEEKVDKCIEDIVDKSNDYENWETKLYSQFKEEEKKHPILVKIVIFMVSIMITFALNDCFTRISQKYYKRSNDVFIVKNIKKEFKYQSFDSETLKKYRIVSYNGLIIKSDCSMKSNTIAKLDVGKVVEILYKNKNWTLIEWECEDGNTNTGWTLTRYLARIKK
ncbi:hypothetical protein CF060_08365 [Clostridium botulinum]|uniref:hypothetical protein n=1 Tax=Clostridium botulinum TaxID=1491 RepID=UPI000C78E3CB|nr:hypothetical protein [Clostridium botulinum]AUN00134.1 hypothetical protein RSJ13_14405 [Clostridium botulinum]QDY29950.1 hypothetical protein CGQ41_14485 [Clostridium botulinum]